MKLVTHNLTFKPEKEFFLNKVSLEFEAGKLYTLLGRTLSGKTSLLKTIAGLQPIDTGNITFEGKDFSSVPVWKRNVAMVYQEFINYPHLSVYDNIAFPLKQRKIKTSDIENEVSVAINKVGLSGFEKRKIQELSGGQQQRVAIARALVNNPDILLADEPTGNLDSTATEEILSIFRDLNKNEGITVIMVTHEEEIADQAQRIIAMKDGLITSDEKTLSNK